MKCFIMYATLQINYGDKVQRRGCAGSAAHMQETRKQTKVLAGGCDMKKPSRPEYSRWKQSIKI